MLVCLLSHKKVPSRCFPITPNGRNVTYLHDEKSAKTSTFGDVLTTLGTPLGGSELRGLCSDVFMKVSVVFVGRFYYFSRSCVYPTYANKVLTVIIE